MVGLGIVRNIYGLYIYIYIYIYIYYITKTRTAGCQLAGEVGFITLAWSTIYIYIYIYIYIILSFLSNNVPLIFAISDYSAHLTANIEA